MTTARVVFLDEGGKEIKTVVLAGLVVTVRLMDQEDHCNNLNDLIGCLSGKEHHILKVGGTITEVA
jgi:hypothetical protein